MKRAVVDGPVAEERRCDSPRLHQLRAVPAAARLQDARPHDAARPHHADLGREEVHRTTPPARAPGRPAEQLGHEFSRWHPLRQSMPMPTVRAENWIVVRQMSTHAGRDRLLPDIGVTRPEEEPSLMAAREFLLRMPDDEHRAEEGKELVIRHSSPSFGVRRFDSAWALYFSLRRLESRFPVSLLESKMSHSGKAESSLRTPKGHLASARNV